MHLSRTSVTKSVSSLLALLLAAAPRPAAAQASPSPAPVHKSVRGTLTRVDVRLGGIVMKADTGENLAWKFNPAVIAEAAKFKPGSPVIVIYRQTSANEKRVTALAFPGAADKPVYVNLTGSRVSLHSAPMKDGVCGQPDAGKVSEAIILPGDRAEIPDACWCCALPSGGACTTGNKTGNGLAFLERCFE
jgi:hypothetical protein